MRFRVHRRAKVCGPELMFEELEQRIVLDASVDSIAVGSHAGGPDLLHGLLAEPGQEGPAVHANAHDGGAWALEYSSDPDAKMTHIVDHHDLALVDVELGSPVPGINLYAVQPVTDANPKVVDPLTGTVQTGVDLSGAIRITGDPTQTLTLTLVPDPRLVNSDGIISLSETTLSGHVDDINAQLATLYGTVYPCFNGFAEIDVQLYDEDHATSSDASPLAVSTLYIPVAQTPQTPAAMVPGPQILDTTLQSEINIPVTLADRDSNGLGVIVSVNHGTVTIPYEDANVANYVQPPVLYIGTLDQDNRPLDYGPRVGVKGPVSNLNGALANLTYQSFPGYHGQDQMTVVVTDERFYPNTTHCTDESTAVVPITVA